MMVMMMAMTPSLKASNLDFEKGAMAAPAFLPDGFFANETQTTPTHLNEPHGMINVDGVEVGTGVNTGCWGNSS
jgi:hypothetical protein